MIENESKRKKWIVQETEFSYTTQLKLQKNLIFLWKLTNLTRLPIQSRVLLCYPNSHHILRALHIFFQCSPKPFIFAKNIEFFFSLSFLSSHFLLFLLSIILIKHTLKIIILISHSLIAMFLPFQPWGHCYSHFSLFNCSVFNIQPWEPALVPQEQGNRLVIYLWDLNPIIN